jgi:beta-lactamase regulating signal transducer with metallopeptidase domain
MNAWSEFVSNQIQNSNFAAVFLDGAIKSIVVLTLASTLCLCWRRTAAATRHLIWFLAVVSLPCLPLLSSLLPSWHRPLWSVATGFNSGNQFSVVLELTPAAVRGSAGDQTPTATVRTRPFRTDDVQPAGTQRIAAHFSSSWLALAFATWFGGVGLVLTAVVVDRLRLRRILRHAHASKSAEWLPLFRKLCAELRLGRTVVLLQSVDNIMPITWGWWQPVVLLPAEAEHWPVERRRVVLLHELAHVKRWDCFTQLVARIVCAFYWFNPLVWLATRRMCIERERACDDLVLNGGCKASDYAEHLVEIARTFRRAPQVAAIAMARSSQLGNRVAAIVDAKRNRQRLKPLMGGFIAVVAVGLAAAVAANKSGLGPAAESGMDSSRFDPRLQVFFAEKERQARSLAQKLNVTVAPEIWEYYQAAAKGDWSTVTNLWGALRKRHSQYEGSTNDPTVSTPVWQTIIETFCAYYPFAEGEKKYALAFAKDIIDSIPPGSIYFGGTDPGRALITAFSKSHEKADPFFTLTQNGLTDARYLAYLRTMYGGKIYTPTDEDSQKCFQDYVVDVQHRLLENKLKPGEDAKVGTNGSVQVSGQVAVMQINGLLAKIILDKNPDRRFYIEESFPFDWMYAYLEPHGLIFKLNRQPLAELSEVVVRTDHDYWTKYVKPMIGDWLNYETPVQEVTTFADRVHLKQDLSGFKGDPLFIRNDCDRQMFSKLRVSIGGVYAWRAEYAANEIEKARMAREADFAFRQALALCPYAPEAVYRYANFLLRQKRNADAILVAETAAQFPSPVLDSGAVSQFRMMVEKLKEFQKAK